MCFLIGLLAALSSFGGIRPGLWLGNSSVRRRGDSSCSNGHRTSFSVLHGRKGQPRVQLKSSKRCPLTWSVRGLCLFERDCPDHQGSSTLLPGGARTNGSSARTNTCPFCGAVPRFGQVTRGPDGTDPPQSTATRCNSAGRNWPFHSYGECPQLYTVANYMNLGLTEYRLLIMPKAGNDRQGLD